MRNLTVVDHPVQLSESVQPPSSEITEADLHAALDTVVLSSLRSVTAGLVALYIVFAVSHALVLPERIAALMSIVAAGTATALLGLHVALRRWSVAARWAHPVGVGIAGLVLLNSFLHLYLTSEPRQTTNFMLLAIGVGFFFLSTRWFVLVLVAIIAGWGLVAYRAGPAPAWLHFAFALFTATVLSILVHAVRVRMLRRHLIRRLVLGSGWIFAILIHTLFNGVVLAVPDGGFLRAIAAVGIGLAGFGVIVLFILRGLQQEQKWLVESLDQRMLDLVHADLTPEEQE